MQAASVQNEQIGTRADAVVERALGPFSGRKSVKKAQNGAFAAFFARFQSSDNARGRARSPRDGADLAPERASSRKAGADSRSQHLGAQLESSNIRLERAEHLAVHSRDGRVAELPESLRNGEGDAKASKARAKDRLADAGAETAAQLLPAAGAPVAGNGKPIQLRGEGGDEPRTERSEASSRKRGRTRGEAGSEPDLRVVDLRLKLEAPSARDAQPNPRDGAGELSALQGRADGAGEGSGKSEAPAGMEAARGKSFSDMLAARLGSDGAVDIVKAAQIVLKDGDSGLIRLRLEPESLGGVKIELRLAEKSIEGRILVESEEAKAAFEKALDGLKDAFAREGFESSSLEVSVGSEGREGNPGTGPGEDSGPFWSERLSSFDRAVPTERAIEARRAEGRVDILA
ncbi:MAG: flagellar hook-length control protein FliK [Spirochaetales bacterium]|nr:flagellar hook-length control protein FliK [Spirochaetales bacterium]